MQIRSNHGVSSNRGDFHAELQGGYLVLPQDIYERLVESRISTVERFATLVINFPTSIATILGWTPEEVVKAKDALVDKLAGWVDDRILHPNPTRQFPFGAKDPRTMKQ